LPRLKARLKAGDADTTANDFQALIERAEKERAERLANQPAARIVGKVPSILHKAAATYKAMLAGAISKHPLSGHPGPADCPTADRGAIKPTPKTDADGSSHLEASFGLNTIALLSRLPDASRYSGSGGTFRHTPTILSALGVIIGVEIAELGFSCSMRSTMNDKRLLSAGLVFAIALDTAGQLLWKLAATRLPADLSPATLVHAILHDPLPLLVVGVFLVQLVNWLFVLERADLSYAQPITSLSYVSVCLLSAWLFRERLDVAKVSGVMLLLVGVVLVSKGPASVSK
jgi:multidrug transporter EmrE-like cation transporter